VPYIDNTKDTPDQALIFVVETAETIYTFNNVSYWSALISNATEFKSFIEFDPGATRFGSNIYNKGLYKLVGDIDFSSDANNGTAVILDYYGRDKADGGYIMGNTGKTGFAGVFDGDGHVLKNCNIQFTGLFGSLSSYKINGNPVILKNFAMTNVTITDNAPIFARGMYDDNVNDYVENVYIQVSSKSQMCYGLVYNPDKTFNVNNLYIEYAKDKIVAPAKYTFDADYSENGKTYITHDTHMWNTQTCNSSVLFGNVTTVSAYDSQFTNIYIASPQPVCAMQIACSSIYATFNHDATNRTHTYKGQGTDGKLIFGYASNETRSYVPVIKELKPEAAEIVAQDGFFDNTKKTAYYCNVCYRFTITEAANATCNITENCTGKFANSGPAGIWDEAAAYIWTFLNIGEGYENKAISATNGIWKFTGIKKYDTPVLMAQANNTYDSFLGEAGNSCWKVVDGKLMWNA
ncbi:MAG: hypothetical protein J6V66_01850, partial [Clostridia bacterium]|nr:hypothetical protein [Clostridia bacterium]